VEQPELLVELEHRAAGAVKLPRSRRSGECAPLTRPLTNGTEQPGTRRQAPKAFHSRDSIQRHGSTPGSTVETALGVKGPQVQILSARPKKPQVRDRFALTVNAPSEALK
jgi:hypothetical protein